MPFIMILLHAMWKTRNIYIKCYNTVKIYCKAYQNPASIFGISEMAFHISTQQDEKSLRWQDKNLS